MVSDIEQAERNSRGRASVMALLAIVVAFNSTFGVQNTMNDDGWRGVAWIATVALGLAIVATSGGLMLNPRLRALMNDELSRANRARAIGFGFFTTIVVALGCYVASWWMPMPVRAGLRLVSGLGLAATLARYAMLEWF